jgi:hypothetical protein
MYTSTWTMGVDASVPRAVGDKSRNALVGGAEAAFETGACTSACGLTKRGDGRAAGSAMTRPMASATIEGLVPTEGYEPSRPISTTPDPDADATRFGTESRAFADASEAIEGTDAEGGSEADTPGAEESLGGGAPSSGSMEWVPDPCDGDELLATASSPLFHPSMLTTFTIRRGGSLGRMLARSRSTGRSRTPPRASITRRTTGSSRGAFRFREAPITSATSFVESCTTVPIG